MIEQLEALGITKEQIIDRIVNTCADRLLLEHRVSTEDGEKYGWDDNSPLAIQLNNVFKSRVDTAIAEVVDKYILPKAAQYIENVTLQATNKWGEKLGQPVTFLEYLTQRAEAYLTEQVDFQGKTKSEDSYGWKGSQARIAHMVHRHLHYAIESAMGNALQTANAAIIGGIEQTVKIKLAEVAEKLAVAVKTK